MLKVSIITVCLNAQATIEQTILSVLNQSYQHIEYLIIDGQSIDGTLEIIHQYQHRISRIVSAKDAGIYDAMNKAVALATGDIVYFLNADDVFYDHDVVGDIVKQFMQHGQADLICGRVEVVNKPIGYQHRFSEHFFVDCHSKRDFFRIGGICHQRVFCRRIVFNKIGSFNSKYSVCADVEWLLRCYAQGLSIVFIPRNIAFYNAQGFSYHNGEKATITMQRIAVFVGNSSIIYSFIYLYHACLRKIMAFLIK